jgi:hypothetical protein
MQAGTACRAAAPNVAAFCAAEHGRTSCTQASSPSLLKNPLFRYPSFLSATNQTNTALNQSTLKSKRACRSTVQCSANKTEDSEGEAPLKVVTGKAIDAAGAGLSWVSPDWLTKLVSSFQGPDESGVPVANAQLNDVQELLGGALFLPLFR